MTLVPLYEATPTDERTRRTRRAVAEAAAAAFKTYGYAATTMGSVAALAGVAPRTLYRHYGTKSALFAASVALSTTDFVDHLTVTIDRMPLREAILTAFADTSLDSSPEARELVALACAENDVWGYWLASSDHIRPHLADVLRRALRPNKPTDNDVEWQTRAGALLGAINTSYRAWAVSNGDSLIELVARAVDTVLPALAPPVQP